MGIGIHSVVTGEVCSCGGASSRLTRYLGPTEQKRALDDTQRRMRLRCRQVCGRVDVVAGAAGCDLYDGVKL